MTDQNNATRWGKAIDHAPQILTKRVDGWRRS
jgi:hypothetical protein